jgi:hypothetical protein
MAGLVKDEKQPQIVIPRMATYEDLDAPRIALVA